MSTNPYLNEYLISVAQNSSAWDKLRLGRFTGSGISALMTDPKTKAAKEAGEMSETAKKYIYEKVMELVTGQSANEATSRAIDWGNEWEEHALRQLQIALDSPEESTELNPSFKLFNDYFGCSPDAFMIHPEFGPVGCEIKCPWNSVNHFHHSQIETAEDLKRVNSDYYWQVMGNMLTFNLPAWVFASYDPRQPEHRMLHHTVILFDPEAAANLCEAMEKAQKMKMQILNEWLEYPKK
jgi:hypothetical protein